MDVLVIWENPPNDLEFYLLQNVDTDRIQQLKAVNGLYINQSKLTMEERQCLNNLYELFQKKTQIAPPFELTQATTIIVTGFLE